MESHYKILHTTCHTEWGGLEKRIFNESLWMKKNGQKIIIAAPPDTPLFSKAKSHGFKVYGINFKRFSTIKDYKFLNRIFYNERPDIVNTHGSADSKLALTAADSAGVPCKILSHHFNADLNNSWLDRRVFKKTSDYIFTNSAYTTDYFKNKFKTIDRKIFTIPTGIVPPETLLDKEEAKDNLAKKLGLESRVGFLGIVGNVTKSIDIFKFIKAFQKIAPRLPDHHLVVAATGKKKDILSARTLIQTTTPGNKVHFLDAKDRSWSFLRALDCQITPVKNSKIVLIEEARQDILKAMYCFCPVITATSNEISDLLQNGKTGLAFKLEHAETLADSLFHILNHEKQTRKRIIAAREMVEKKHTIDTSGKYILKLLRLFQIKSDGPERDIRS